MEIFSIHRGSFNYFNELLREITERGNPKGFSLHKITLENALNEGFLYTLQCKLPPDDPRMQMDEADYFSFIRQGSADEESFQQEFCCQPADDNTAFLPYDLIAGCEYKENQQWQTDLLDCKNPLFLGVDVGRERDLTVIWLIEQVNDIRFTRRVVELSKQTFEAQEHALYELLKLPAVRRCCIDRSGLGRQFAERATAKFGAYKVEGIDFTTGTKEDSLTRCGARSKIAPSRFPSPMPCALISAAYVAKSPAPGISALPASATDTAIAIASGRSPWPSTQARHPQPALSRPKRWLGYALEAGLALCWRQGACSRQDRFNQGRELATSRALTPGFCRSDDCIGSRRESASEMHIRSRLHYL